MKLRVAPLVILLSSVAAPALAQTCTPPTEDNFGIGIAPDGNAASVFFSDFFATAGGAGPATTTITCPVSVDLARDGFSLYSGDYRGFAQIDTGQSVVLVDQNGTIVDEDGPFIGDFPANTRFYSTAPGEVLDLDLVLTLDGGAGPDASASVDSLDIFRSAFASTASVQGSLDALAGQRAATALHLYGDTDLLLGFLNPLEGPNEISAIGAVGSALVGATGRLNFGEGLSFLGGAAYFDQSAGADASGALLAGALRYVEAGSEPLRVFAEAGIWGSPDIDLAFSRSFEQQTQAGPSDPVVTTLITSGAAVDGSLIGIYGRLGAVYALNPSNELAFSATVGRDWFHTEGWTESGGGNLFAATFADQTSSSNFVKATLAWTSSLTAQIDLTASVALGHTFGDGHDVDASLLGTTLTGDAPSFTFVEYGARVGWQATDRLSVDGFVYGTTAEHLGTHLQVGAGVSFAF